MKEDLNQQFEERYLLVLSDEERLYESISELTKEFAEGKIPSDPNTLTPIEEDNSRKTPVNKTYSEPLSRTTEEPTHDEVMNNIMKKFHS